VWLREPDLSRPRPGEHVYWELKLLADHRDDLVDQRRRTQQRLRWHLFQLDATFVVPVADAGPGVAPEAHLVRVAQVDPDAAVCI
jgi:hypothetical protein